MTESPAGLATARVPSAHAGVGRILWLAVAAVLPAGILLLLFVDVAATDTSVVDFHSFYVAGQALAHGESPYPEYVYPPLTAILAIPLSLLPLGLAEMVVMLLIAAGVVGTLLALDVRDWRCYGIAFLWPPVLSAIQTGNITIPLAFCAALAWRFRDRPLASSLSIGVTLAAKFFLWPLVVWQLASRGVRDAVRTCVAAAGLLLLSWAVIGFAGVTDYADIVRRVEGVVGEDAYTVRVVALDLGLPSALASGVWFAVAAAVLAGCVAVARRGNDRGAFVLAIGAALAFSPIVWLHYFALSLVVVAIAQPRLGALWFVPLLMVVTPGSGHPTPFETAATLAVAALTFGLALRAATPSSLLGSAGLAASRAQRA